MIFERFHLPELGHASYLVGDQKTGKAFVLDPERRPDAYLKTASEKGLEIVAVIDTHGHNDYLSGMSELHAHGAQRWFSSHGEYSVEGRGLKDGEQIEWGDLGIEVIHTPGHTPEHISLLVYDRSVSADVPLYLLSGGALLVGDVARPDLLGGQEAAKKAARVFCETLQHKVKTLPPHLLVYPTHVAGSLCGGSIGERLETTLGYELETNPVLNRAGDPDEFTKVCISLDNLPAVPPYWPRMRPQNLEGAPLMGTIGEVPRLDPETAAKHLLLDIRSMEEFANAHVPGSLHVPAKTTFPTWAGTVLEADTVVALIADSLEDAEWARWNLLRIGYPEPAGWLKFSDFDVKAEETPFVDVDDLDGYTVVDVRQPQEWSDGHVPGSTFLTGAELPKRIDELDRRVRIATMCGGGGRATIAAAYLQANGFSHVSVARGGISEWKRRGKPTE